MKTTTSTPRDVDSEPPRPIAATAATAATSHKLRFMHRAWLALPYPIRKPATAIYILAALARKQLSGVSRRQTTTPNASLGSLAFWGVPTIDLASYRLRVDGLVDRPTELTFDQLKALPQVERPMQMDCVDGFRNNTVMAGVRFADVAALVQPSAAAKTVVFHCADGYVTSHALDDVRAADALLAVTLNSHRVAELGFPLRLAMPGTYGYKWAKWIVRIELVAGTPKGYWESRGLPQRGRVGDIW